MFVFDPAAGTWTSGPKLPEAVHHASMVSTPDGLVLVGGYVGDALSVATAAVRRLDDGATAWTDDAPLPDARAAGAAAFDGTRIVYAGGVKPGGVANEVFAPDRRRRVGRRSAACRSRASTSRRPRTVPGGRSCSAGASAASTRNLAIVDLVEGDVGHDPRRAADASAAASAAFWWPSLGACLAGGESPGGTNPQVECMAADGTLARLPDLGVARHGIGAAVVDGTAYVVLGGRTPGLSTSDITESIALP